MQHEAMQSFVGYARTPSSDNFTEVIPRELMPGQPPVLSLRLTTFRCALLFLSALCTSMSQESGVQLQWEDVQRREQLS